MHFTLVKGRNKQWTSAHVYHDMKEDEDHGHDDDDDGDGEDDPHRGQ